MASWAWWLASYCSYILCNPRYLRTSHLLRPCRCQLVYLTNASGSGQYVRMLVLGMCKVYFALAGILIFCGCSLHRPKRMLAAPASADFANLCKNDPACRNNAVWFSTDHKVQFCNAPPIEGNKKKYIMKKSHQTALCSEMNDSS